MAEERLALTELLKKTGDGDLLRNVAEAVLQLLMEADVDGLIGAGREAAQIAQGQRQQPACAKRRRQRRQQAKG